jgi:hypothetical protein
LGFLSLQDAANASATSRKMRYEIPPTHHAGRESIITIGMQAMKAPSIPNIFKNVRTISLFQQGASLSRDPVFAIILVPFLSRFPHLELVKFDDFLKASILIFLLMTREKEKKTKKKKKRI